jgi:hypothetical protein
MLKNKAIKTSTGLKYVITHKSSVKKAADAYSSTMHF